MGKYNIYVLIKDMKPIYIGCSGNFRQRISSHRKTKDFDKCIIIESFEKKEMALTAERAIIKYISLVNDEFNVNGKYVRYNDLIKL